MKERTPINQVPIIPRKIINTYFDPTQNAPNNQALLNSQAKTETFQTYLKEKAIDLKVQKEKPRKEFMQVGTEPNSQYSESKPFQKGVRRILAKSEQKNFEYDNEQKRAYDVPSVNKTKAASNNFRHKINKNVIKDTMTEKAREPTPPKSQQSFRVRLHGGNKRLLEDLSKLNEEERTLQYEIMQLHSQTKKELSDTLDKYQIKKIEFNSANFGSFNYESIDENDSFKNSPKKNKFLNDSIEEKKLDKLNKEIEMINKNLEIRKNEIIKREAKIESMPLYSYLNFSSDIFEERESEEENEQVEELPKNNQKSDPSKTYQSVMSEMRKKKWSLNQRFNYDDNAKMGESRIADKSLNKDTLTSVGVKEGDEETKIVVNERLKNLLLS